MGFFKKSGAKPTAVSTQIRSVTQHPFGMFGFPDNRGIPEDFDKLKTRIEEIIPCHLAAEYRFTYSTWQELMSRLLNWTAIEGNAKSWRQLEIYE